VSGFSPRNTLHRVSSDFPNDSNEALFTEKGGRDEHSNMQRPILAMKLNMIIAVSAIALVGNYVWQSHDLKLGPYEYQVSAKTQPSRHTHSEARRMALSGAGKKCASLGKQIDVFDVQSRLPLDPGNDVANVTFVCK
jgi:hypothetical protein